MDTKFYIDTEANDDDAYKLAMQFACKLAKKDSSIKKITETLYTTISLENSCCHFLHLL